MKHQKQKNIKKQAKRPPFEKGKSGAPLREKKPTPPKPTRPLTPQEKLAEENHTPCPLYRKCGGCQLQNMSYLRQLRWKQGKVETLLGKFHRVEPIIGMEHPYHYRNKVQAAFALTRDKKIISGVYQSSTHRVVPVDHCMTEDQTADRIIGSVRKLMREFKLTVFNEDTGSGFLRHVLVKRGFSSNQIMVVLVTGTPVFPAKKRFVEALLKLHPEITTVLMNLNPFHTSMVLGESEKVLYGPGFIEDTLCGCVFRISAKSFYQINPVQTEILYRKAVEFAELSNAETVIDAYCGIGTIGLVAAKQSKQVIGVELNRDAVKDAIANAKRNGIENARFYQGDAGEFMTGMAAQGQSADVVFMDPPRAGSDRAFLSSVVTLSPKRIVYISCNPETQERDLRYLTKNGYTVTRIQPVDMFPHTNHVETVVLLSREKADDYIRISVHTKDLQTKAN
ncbi:MAG: 23S rRNA (uracil(1939)-C(5))-methyltransferase RlmD [Oscillospiraceae bacterium]|nr:23S rRNA (uracil(1939)-C(5))-methyltransferase RlmD [Oscillospiraceae bacterium]